LRERGPYLGEACGHRLERRAEVEQVPVGGVTRPRCTRRSAWPVAAQGDEHGNRATAHGDLAWPDPPRPGEVVTRSLPQLPQTDGLHECLHCGTQAS
jgi:hypothetical protein